MKGLCFGNWHLFGPNSVTSKNPISLEQIERSFKNQQAEVTKSLGVASMNQVSRRTAAGSETSTGRHARIQDGEISIRDGDGYPLKIKLISTAEPQKKLNVEFSCHKNQSSGNLVYQDPLEGEPEDLGKTKAGRELLSLIDNLIQAL